MKNLPSVLACVAGAFVQNGRSTAICRTLAELERSLNTLVASQARLLPDESEARDPKDSDLPEPSADELRTLIRERLLSHLTMLGLDANPPGLGAQYSKDLIRAYHRAQRCQIQERERPFVQKYVNRLLQHFACGEEIDPARVRPVLCPIDSAESADARLFRLATLLWSVPVSRGFGRRMRYLVRDETNGKLMGIFALTDPVFNLRARDAWIGWDANDRRERLVDVMDAYVVGAVPPYSSLLGGKIVAALMTSQEVANDFAHKYGDMRGIISQKVKSPKLALITVTSALGRSSLYNRLRIPGMFTFERVGMTEGWGHFQVPDALFMQMRKLLEYEGHSYASGHQYGDGPNWRMRVVREALKRAGLDENLLRHGVAREIYAAPLGVSWRDALCGRTPLGEVLRPSAAELGRRAVARWLIPRAERRPEFRQWTVDDTWQMLTHSDDTPMARD